MTGSFFDEGPEVSRGDALGVSGTMADLTRNPRMEAIMLIETCTMLLDEFGQRSELTFDENTKATLSEGFGDSSNRAGSIQTEEVVTTEGSAPYVLNGTTYYLRPVRFLPGSEFGDDVFFVLDETAEFRDMEVRNPFLIKLEVGDNEGEIPGVEIRGVDGITIDDPDAVDALQNRLDVIVEAEQERVAEIKRLEEREELNRQQDRLDRQRQAEFEQASRRSPGRKLLDLLSRTSPTDVLRKSVALVALGGVAGGAFFGIRAAYREANDFDCLNTCKTGIYDSDGPRLSAGTTLSVGDTVVPLTTFELSQNEQFFRSTVPEVGVTGSSDNGDFGPNALGGKSVEDPANIDFAREIVLTTSNPDTDTNGNGKLDASCDRVYVDIQSPEDELIVAMPSTQEDRIDEFSFTFEDGGSSVLFCWKGKENGVEDDPYLVFHRTGTPMIPADERDIRPQVQKK